jgi:hypothetical protein
VYGPNQYPDKIIPLFALNLMKGEKSYIHGHGLQKRSFLHVSDVAKAFELILFKGVIGEIYNIGCDDDMTVNDIAQRILEIVRPDSNFDDWFEYGQDRPFNDQRYHICSEKIKSLGWTQKKSFNAGLFSTIDWYKSNMMRYDGVIRPFQLCTAENILVELDNYSHVERFNILLDIISDKVEIIPSDYYNINYYAEIFHIIKFLKHTDFYNLLNIDRYLTIVNNDMNAYHRTAR